MTRRIRGLPGFSLCIVMLLASWISVACTQRKPEIRLTATRVKLGDIIDLSGSGFTPERSALSHLLKPDGTEYNPLRFRINAKGELVHKIDTVMLDVGIFEVWIEDEASGVLSNRVRFTTVE